MKLIPVLDEIDKKILELLCEGVRQTEIPGKVWKSQSTVRKRIERLRKHYQVQTTIQLIIKINKEVA